MNESGSVPSQMVASLFATTNEPVIPNLEFVSKPVIPDLSSSVDFANTIESSKYPMENISRQIDLQSSAVKRATFIFKSRVRNTKGTTEIGNRSLHTQHFLLKRSSLDMIDEDITYYSINIFVANGMNLGMGPSSEKFGFPR